MAETIVPGERHYIPDPELPNLRFRFSIDPETRKMVVQSTSDSGSKWLDMIAEVPGNAGTGWIPVTMEGGKIRWMPISRFIQQSSVSGTTPPPSGGGSLQGYIWTDFSFPAELQNGVSFGMFEVPPEISFNAVGAQISIFAPPQVSNLTVRFVNRNTGLPLSDPVHLLPGEIYRSSMFLEQVTLGPGTKINAVVNFSSSSFPGAFLVARLLLNSIV
jgi:hypothetical protein